MFTLLFRQYFLKSFNWLLNKDDENWIMDECSRFSYRFCTPTMISIWMNNFVPRLIRHWWVKEDEGKEVVVKENDFYHFETSKDGFCLTNGSGRECRTLKGRQVEDPEDGIFQVHLFGTKGSFFESLYPIGIDITHFSHSLYTSTFSSTDFHVFEMFPIFIYFGALKIHRELPFPKEELFVNVVLDDTFEQIRINHSDKLSVFRAL